MHRNSLGATTSSTGGYPILLGSQSVPRARPFLPQCPWSTHCHAPNYYPRRSEYNPYLLPLFLSILSWFDFCQGPTWGQLRKRVRKEGRKEGVRKR